MDKKENIPFGSLEKFANVLSADSLEEALYYAKDDEELKKLILAGYEKAKSDPEKRKRAELLHELECLGKTDEEIQNLEKIRAIRKRGYSGESLEVLSKEYGMTYEEVKKLFEHKILLTINYCSEKEYNDIA